MRAIIILIILTLGWVTTALAEYDTSCDRMSCLTVNQCRNGQFGPGCD